MIKGQLCSFPTQKHMMLLKIYSSTSSIGILMKFHTLLVMCNGTFLPCNIPLLPASCLHFPLGDGHWMAGVLIKTVRLPYGSELCWLITYKVFSCTSFAMVSGIDHSFFRSCEKIVNDPDNLSCICSLNGFDISLGYILRF